MENNYLFFVVHKRGNNLKYCKTTEEHILKIHDAFQDTAYIMEARSPDDWENNIKTGKSYEACTRIQVTDFIEAVLKPYKE